MWVHYIAGGHLVPKGQLNALKSMERSGHHPRERSEEPEGRGSRETQSEWFVPGESDLICSLWSRLGLGREGEHENSQEWAEVI